MTEAYMRRPTTNKEKLNVARALLSEIEQTWDEDNVAHYDCGLSFDELVCELYSIELKK